MDLTEHYCNPLYILSFLSFKNMILRQFRYTVLNLDVFCINRKK